MDWNVYPCIIYQRLRPSAPEASRVAVDTVWPLIDEVVAREDYTPCGLYGDSEFAAPFCGGSEIRPGFQLALQRARLIASRLGFCTLLIGDGSVIGDGDPFLPACQPSEANGGVDMRMAHFHLRRRPRSISLRSAWRHFEKNKKREYQAALAEKPLQLAASTGEIELLIRRDPSRLLARIFLANPGETPVTFKWRQMVRQEGRVEPGLEETEWSTVEVPGGCAAYLDTIFQGELPWVRQLRVRHQAWGRKVVGSAHVTPSDMLRDRLPLIWEDQA